MNNQGNPGWPNQPVQSPLGQPPGLPPGSPPGVPPPAPPYGQPPTYPPPGTGAPYGAPPSYGAPPVAQPGQSYPPGPPLTRPPYPGTPYAQSPYGAPSAPKRGIAPWIIVVAALGALLILAVIGGVVRYATQDPAVNSIEFAHNFQNNKAVDITATFKSTDPDFYAIIHLNTTKGTPNVKVVWTVVNATDANKRPVTGQEFGQVEKAATSTLLYVSISRGSNLWPVGQYKADIFLDGILAKTAQFTVTA